MNSLSKSSDLIEIFSAIQGEGPIVGRRQIFLRFGHCDVKCDYCDTPLCHVELASFRAETAPGSREFVSLPNPADDSLVIERVLLLDEPRSRHHSVALTGGEPLLHAEAIARIGPAFREAGLLVYLETNGHLVAELETALGGIDIIGMDIKTPSTTGFAARFDDNLAFLKRATAAEKDIFVKLVVGDSTPDEELEAAFDLVASVDPDLTTILQPVTPFAGKGTPPSPDRLLAMHDLALGTLPNARVIPQTHKMIQQR